MVRMIDEQKEELIYQSVDVQGLINRLSQYDWDKLTSGIPEEDIYELIAAPGEDDVVQINKQIRGDYASLFFDIQKIYADLINTYIKR